MSIYVASSQQSFLMNAIITSTHHNPNNKDFLKFISNNNYVSCTSSINQQQPERNRHEITNSFSGKQNQLMKLAVVTLAAGVLTLGSVHDASAAKSGGRIGGQAFRPSAPPRSSSPRINNSRITPLVQEDDINEMQAYREDLHEAAGARTNIYINPPVAPPLVGGFGYGYGGVPFYGGWGWSPFSFFTPGPSAAIGIGAGFETLALFMFLGAAAAVIRRVFGSRNQDDDY